MMTRNRTRQVLGELQRDTTPAVSQTVTGSSGKAATQQLSSSKMSSEISVDNIVHQLKVVSFSSDSEDDIDDDDVSDYDDEEKGNGHSGEVKASSHVDILLTGEVVKLIKSGDLKKLKVDQCRSYLRSYSLRLTGTKPVLMDRIKQHIELLEGGSKAYERSTFTVDCTGDVCKGDVVMFDQKVYENYNVASRGSASIGSRTVAGRVVKESYGAKRQQHTFTVEVLWSSGCRPLAPMKQLLVKGRNLYKRRTFRQVWADETERRRSLDEKHERGAAARYVRASTKHGGSVGMLSSGSVFASQKQLANPYAETLAPKENHHPNIPTSRFEDLHVPTAVVSKQAKPSTKHSDNSLDSGNVGLVSEINHRQWFKPVLPLPVLNENFHPKSHSNSGSLTHGILSLPVIGRSLTNGQASHKWTSGMGYRAGQQIDVSSRNSGSYQQEHPSNSPQRTSGMNYRQMHHLTGSPLRTSGTSYRQVQQTDSPRKTAYNGYRADSPRETVGMSYRGEQPTGSTLRTYGMSYRQMDQRTNSPRRQMDQPPNSPRRQMDQPPNSPRSTVGMRQRQEQAMDSPRRTVVMSYRQEQKLDSPPRASSMGYRQPELPDSTSGTSYIKPVEVMGSFGGISGVSTKQVEITDSFGTASRITCREMEVQDLLNGTTTRYWDAAVVGYRPWRGAVDFPCLSHNCPNRGSSLCSGGFCYYCCKFKGRKPCSNPRHFYI